MKKRKIPLRTCVGCTKIRPKRELVRIIVGEKAEIVIDLTGKAKGRGAYLCRIPEEIERVQSENTSWKEDKVFTANKECLENATRKKSFGRAFRKKVKQSSKLQVTNKI